VGYLDNGALYNSWRQASKFLLAVFGCACLLRATIVPMMELNKLSEKGDVIVVASVADVREIGPTTVTVPAGNFAAMMYTARLQVEKVLKGRTEGPTLNFRFAYPYARLGYGSVSTGQFGIFFLRMAEEGWVLVDPYNPMGPAVAGAPESEGTPLDRVIAEIAYLFTSPSATFAMRQQAEIDLLPVVTAKSTAALKLATRDPNREIRAIGMGMLFQRGEISMLETAAKMLLDPQQTLNRNEVSVLATGISEGVNDPKACPILTKLLDCRYIEIRRAAAAALGHTRSQSAVQPLCGALQQGDRDVQYEAVIGLAGITGTVGDWAPSVDRFRKDPQSFVDHWLQWAQLQK